MKKIPIKDVPSGLEEYVFDLDGVELGKYALQLPPPSDTKVVPVEEGAAAGGLLIRVDCSKHERNCGIVSEMNRHMHNWCAFDRARDSIIHAKGVIIMILSKNMMLTRALDHLVHIWDRDCTLAAIVMN